MSSRYAFQSPSITSEKGAYRMRAPRSTRPAFESTVRHDSSSVMANANKHVHCEPGPPTQDRKVALVVALLAIGSCLCFGTAYYLYTTRCGTRSFVSSSSCGSCFVSAPPSAFRKCACTDSNLSKPTQCAHMTLAVYALALP